MYFVITPLKFVDVVVVIIGYFWIFRGQTKYMPLIFPLKGKGQASTSFSSCTMRYLTSIPHENMVKNNTNISPATVSYFDSRARRRRLILTIFVKNVLGLKIQFNESVIHLSQISWRLVMCMVYPLCYVLVCCFHYLYFSCLICFSLILPLSLSPFHPSSTLNPSFLSPVCQVIYFFRLDLQPTQVHVRLDRQRYYNTLSRITSSGV